MNAEVPVSLRVLAPAFEAAAGERTFTLVPTNVNQLLGVRFLLRLAVSLELDGVPRFVSRSRVVAGTKLEFADAVDVAENDLPRRVSEEPRQALARVFADLGVPNPLAQVRGGWTVSVSELDIDLVRSSERFVAALSSSCSGVTSLAGELAEILTEFEKCFSNLHTPTAHEPTVFRHVQHLDEEIKTVHRAMLSEHVRASEAAGDDVSVARLGRRLFVDYRDASDAETALAYYRSAADATRREERLRHLVAAYGAVQQLPLAVRSLAANDRAEVREIGRAALHAGPAASGVDPKPNAAQSQGVVRASETGVAPSAVQVLLDEANAAERRGDFPAELAASRNALELAQKSAVTSPETQRELAASQRAHSHALLATAGDLEEAWRLADLAADPTLLDGHPDLLFEALTTKAEVAAATGRMQQAGGAVAALAPLASSETQHRYVLQLRGRVALASNDPSEARKAYSEAAQAFMAALGREADQEKHALLRRGVASCLTNQGVAMRALGDIVGALATFSSAADWYEQAGAQADESAARRLLARCHFDEQEWDDGFESLDRAERLARDAKAKFELIECIELRARALATIDEASRAREVLTEGLHALGGDDADTSRRFHQMLATLAETQVTREHLERARLLAERPGDALKVADVEHQFSRLGKKGRDREAAPPEVIAELRRKLRETQRPAVAALTMQQLAGAHRSHGDLDKARDWYQRAHNAALGAADQALAASALIGLGEIAVARDDGDEDALHLLEEALRLVEGLPAWEVRASAKYFVGRIQARGGDLHAAKGTLEAALELARVHHIEHLEAELDEYLDDVNDRLSLRRAPAMSFTDMADELAGLEDWYPDAARRLRRFWYYQRSDEIPRTLRSHAGAKALIVSETAGEVARLSDDLGRLFDLTFFVSEQPFADSGERTLEFVPVPETGVWPFINIVGVTKGEADPE